MNRLSQWQVCGSPAEAYEKVAVPAVFARLVPILDVACWRGIVARKVAEFAFPIARLLTATVQVGFDLFD